MPGLSNAPINDTSDNILYCKNWGDSKSAIKIWGEPMVRIREFGFNKFAWNIVGASSSKINACEENRFASKKVGDKHKQVKA